ncbi:MAG: DUF1343 domain-containing protein [Cyclobacteriaceae bacterium]|nr:DUF1343 domain-containing protein [Cyclobacteriaceae bacterium HetDA_MAG_MS6]
MLRILSLTLFFIGTACSSQISSDQQELLVGAARFQEYLPMLKGKRVGLTVNHTSRVGNTHLIDTLISMRIELTTVFSPEHGLKGTAADGEHINYEDKEYPFKLHSLYGKNRKPTAEMLTEVDIMLFDIQDVGARFYTYISTMHYVMEACAESNIPFIVLDRPNPNGSYVDGPVLDTAYKSFVGMHPIPIVHGLTIGELAQMINGEKWLKDGLTCALQVIPVTGWSHDQPYSLPLKPSPNLPDDRSIALYPSICLFEQTIASEGRGTDFAFQQVGHPDYPDTSYSFVPRNRQGSSAPKFEGQKCFGLSFKDKAIEYKFSLSPLIEFYEKLGREDFFKSRFHVLAGTKQLQQQIEKGLTEEQIKASWQADLNDYKKKRKKYLIYPESSPPD